MLVDMHSHILPGLDDGAKNWDIALEMARIAVSDGIHYMFATPHYMNDYFVTDSVWVKELVEEFQHKLEAHHIPLQVMAGHEIYLGKTTVDLLEKGIVRELGFSRYALVEFPMNRIPEHADDTLYEAIISGFIPIIAHPERCAEVWDHTDLLLPYIDNGVLLQMNAGSVLGHFGRKVKRTAEELIHRRMIHLVGSDAHNVERRPPKMRAAYDVICRLGGAEYAEEIFYDNGLAVIKDEDIVMRSVLSKIKKGWFYRPSRRYYGA